MSVTVVVGAQWGDEGKGKITDVLSKDVDYVVRYQGGNNAGHTICFSEETFKLHLIPSGIFNPKCICVIGNGVVLDPIVFFEELDKLLSWNLKVEPSRLRISGIAHVIFSFYRWIDANQEEGLADSKIGTTRRGIGPAYTHKVSRSGGRILDLLDASRLKSILERITPKNYLLETNQSIEDLVKLYNGLGERLKPYIDDTSLLVNTAIDAGKCVILEGAQGTMLDIDHGTYPYVTSSSPIAGGACIGVGLGPLKIKKVLGVAKAYVTRVGEGQFPTELDCNIDEYLREKGSEFGTTTSRPRRCGWLDLVALKYAVRVNGITSLCLTKLDVLGGMEVLKLCTAYKRDDGALITNFPLDREILTMLQPVYKTMDGWSEDISELTNYDDLPLAAKIYAEYISSYVGVPIELISVGTSRLQIIMNSAVVK